MSINTTEIGLQIERSLGLLASEPRGLYATTFEEYSFLLNALFQALGRSSPVDYLQHESEHARAARLIGCNDLVYGVVLHPPKVDASWGNGIGIQSAVDMHFGPEHCLLQRAAVSAHPTLISDFDRLAMGGYGFNLEDVVRAAESANQAAGRLVVPVPLSA